MSAQSSGSGLRPLFFVVAIGGTHSRAVPGATRRPQAPGGSRPATAHRAAASSGNTPWG